MARGVLADPSSCDPKAGEQTGMSQTSPASAWLESKAPASRSLAVQPAVPVGMWGLQKPRPVSLAPRASQVPGEHVIPMGRLPGPQLAELRGGWTSLPPAAGEGPGRGVWPLTGPSRRKTASLLSVR